MKSLNHKYVNQDDRTVIIGRHKFTSQEVKVFRGAIIGQMELEKKKIRINVVFPDRLKNGIIGKELWEKLNERF